MVFWYWLSRSSVAMCCGGWWQVPARPCLPSRAVKAPSADGWIHEIKHDGFRLQIHVRGQRVKLYTMTGMDWTERSASRRATERA